MYLAEVLPGIPGFDSSMSVSKWYEKWMELYKVRNLKATTIRNYEEKYGKEGAQSIIDNCMLIYLKTGNIETANKISERLGTYTAQSYGESSNSNNKYDKASSSMSLISRKLLTPDEVLMIENPYALVMVTGKPPAITTIPDISKMHFNKINGMGSKEHNQMLRIERENAREERPIKPIKIWNIWDKQTEEKMPRMKVEVIQDNFRKNLKGK